MTDRAASAELAEFESTIPTWHNFMRPILEVLAGGEVWTKKDLEQATLDRVGITSTQREEQVPSGQYRALNRIGWAMSSLTRAQAAIRPARATFQITDIGRRLLADQPGLISENDLRAIPAFQNYLPARVKAAADAASLGPVDVKVPASGDDPTELIEAGIAAFVTETASELIRKLRGQHPDFFEQAVVDVLNKMGYGGAEERGRRLGGTGDGGVDGFIDQDALGLNRIYVQAKRYGEGNSVQRPELQGFVGALAGKGANQGVFVTTSLFSKGAREYVEQIPSRVVLIDGPRLADLMIRYRVGVQVKQTYDVVEVDEDYFE